MRGGDEPAYNPNAVDDDSDSAEETGSFAAQHGAPVEGDDPGYAEDSPEEVRQWERLSKQLDEPLYDGARSVTVRQAAYAMYQLKVRYSMHDEGFNCLCKLLKRVLPDGNRFPGCDILNRRRNADARAQRVYLLPCCLNAACACLLPGRACVLVC